MKNKSKIDVAVLLIFFCREQQFEKVFAAVKEARPSRLYLYQDAPRKGREDDVIGCKKCREIAENIDWECEVHRFYQENNVGCDPSEYIAQKWMFETEDMGIILEDDDVPSQSFFPFCKELLEKYKNDTRINMICGMNHEGISQDIEESYFFTRGGSIWGWASWKRVLDTWDGSYSWLDDAEKMKILKKNINSNRRYKLLVKNSKKHRATGREHYESINGAACELYGRVNIVPKYNMICNIGIAKESTHAVSDIRLLPKKVQKLLYMQTYEIDFPLIHPKEIKLDLKREKNIIMTTRQIFLIKVESIFRTVKYQGLNGLFNRVKNKFRKIISKK